MGNAAESRDNRLVDVAVVLVAVALGIATAIFIAPGLPYDEPAHWANAVFMANNYRLPVIGHVGTSYEAQQGPVAYVVAAATDRLWHALSGSSSGAFYAVRVLGGIEFLASAWWLRSILRHIVPTPPGRLIALATYLTAPMFVAMFWSVQNDGLCLALSFAALVLALHWGAEGFDLKRALLIGVLSGLALVTKLSAFPILFAIPLWLILRLGVRRGIRQVSAFGVGALVFSGWWFVWNLATLGRLVPPTEINGNGPSSAPYGFHGLSTSKHIVENVTTYLWVPSEYYRNLISFSGVLKTLIALVTAGICVLGGWALVTSLFGRRPAQWSRPSIDASIEPEAWTLIGLTALIAIVVWLFLFIRVTAIAPRLGYLALPAWFGLVALAFNRVASWSKRPVVFEWLAISCLVGLNVWVLVHAARLSHLPFEIRF